MELPAVKVRSSSKNGETNYGYGYDLYYHDIKNQSSSTFIHRKKTKVDFKT